jgi:hypothetical protein
MVKMALQRGRYFNALKDEIAGTLRGICQKAETINAGPGEKAKEKLEKIRAELSGIGEKIPKEGAAGAYNGLFYIKMRLGAIERELSLLDFFGQKKD